MPEVQVVVVGVLRAKSDHVDDVLAGLSSATEQTHAEEGCVKYTINQVPNDRQRIVIVETWRSRADLEEHFKQPYTLELGKNLGLLEEPPQIYFLDPVPAGDDEKGRL